MHPTLFHRLTLPLLGGLLLAAGVPLVHAGGPPNDVFQPLNSPASTDHFPGKFVWADLFTTDPAAATKFYSGLFGWTANKIEQNGQSYTVFSNGSRPVAGLAPRSSKTRHSSRWIGYIAVRDVDATLALVTKSGGQVRARALDFPDRGRQAIVSDPEDCTLGLLQSSSGDPADLAPQAGDWNWFELYVKNPKTTAAFYGKAFGYDVAPDTRTERKDDFLLLNGQVARGGVAPLPESDDGRADWLGVVRIENMDEAIARVRRLGGEVLVAPREAAYESRFAIIADSTGGTIGLVEYVDNAKSKRP
ncbi:MAG TPA: VOC family protein [Opitutaceae bacterium]|nr:VOC family protein [Opitutaceae bacterium]